MRTGGLLHRRDVVLRPAPQLVVVLAEEPAAIRVHCNACGDAAEFIGGPTRSHAKDWMSAHWQPVIDEMDIADVEGRPLGTWRRR